MASILLATGLFALSLKSSKGLVPEPGWKVELVEKKPTVREQFFHAMVQGSVAQWKAVETYFPPEQSDAFLSYNLKAWLQLARVAIAQKDFDLAQQTCPSGKNASRSRTQPDGPTGPRPLGSPTLLSFARHPAAAVDHPTDPSPSSLLLGRSKQYGRIERRSKVPSCGLDPEFQVEEPEWWRIKD
jgi:hypothetical protein